jgi:hypothetical protein
MAAPEWAPGVEQVAVKIRARTRIDGGFEEGTFTEDTTPTDKEAEVFIENACQTVHTAIGSQEPCTDALKSQAGAAAATRAALDIEQSLWPEQSSAAGSTAQGLRSDWKEQIKALADAVAEQCGGEGTGVGGALAAGSFEDGRNLIGPSCPTYW